MQHSILRVAGKEVATFFSSPIAFIFFGVFLIVNLFVFFWVETFFSRNITDVRPLFEWMPILLILLVSALTMRMWSEERRMGTLEFLLTQPVRPLHLVFGKFLACMALVTVALLLTLPIPFTVSLMGNLDWGPVFGAYVATLFLAAAYIAIGLTVSAKSENQIVSLIVTVLVCAVFYLLGSDTITSLFGSKTGEFFKALGSGSRFTSITRGVIDLRDIYYYLSIVGVFISLNVYFLESGRWARETGNKSHTQWRLITGLLIANFVAGNVWLQQINWARADITQGNVYSISSATDGYLQQLQEPLLIRGYFSAKTHPLLAPLVPQIRDLILEYQVAGDGKIRSEFIDPLENPDLEEEAGQKYGIKPVPFQVADKYQASLVNSYFDVLIKYGDQYQVLGFRDLIEVKAQTEGDIDVKLRNPEYEITRSIKKVLYEYQSSGDLFASVAEQIKFTGYVSPQNRLPEPLAKFQSEIQAILDEMKKSSGDKFEYAIEDPDANGGAVAKNIAENFGFQPMRAGLLDPNTFYYYMVMSVGDQAVQVPLPEDLEKESFRRSIEAALKRFSTGFLRSLALHTPPATPPNMGMQQMRMPSGKQFQLLEGKLGENHKVENTDLANGYVPDDADLLLLAAPKNFDNKQIFAVDQFLMKGGTVIIASSPYEPSFAAEGLSVSKTTSGLEPWLEHHGIKTEDTMVLDPRNARLPIPINRNLGGFTVREVKMVEYPYFVDIRGAGLEGGGDLTGSLPQLTLNWASPIEIDAAKAKGRQVTHLVKSSVESWTSNSTQVVPDFQTNGQLGFKPADTRGSKTLGVAVEGRFESFFKGKDSPLLTAEKDKDESQPKAEDKKEEKKPVISSIIDKSPESARIILFASNDFLTDQTMQLAASSGGTEYLNSLELIENAVDWSLEDRGLLSIRGRGHYSRTLSPLSNEEHIFWEYLNYGLALLGLFLVYMVYKFSRAKATRRYQQILQQGGA